MKRSMPREGEASSSREAQAGSQASTSSTDPEDALLRRQETPVATPRKTNTFRNLMAKFHGCRNLTPKKLALIINAPDSDEEITERTARMIEEESTTDEEQEDERVRPPRRKAAKKAPPAAESVDSSVSDISGAETGSEYAPSEVEGTRDFSGFEEISDVELQRVVQEEEEHDARESSSDSSDVAPPRPRVPRVLGIRRPRGRRARARGRARGRGRGVASDDDDADDVAAAADGGRGHSRVRGR